MHSVARVPDIACEVCGGTAIPWRRIAGHDHFRCRVCRHLFVYPRPRQEELDRFYGNPEYYTLASAQETRLHFEATARARLLSQVAADLGLGKRVLDVGCATGIFLAAMHSEGWSASGVERSAGTAQLARGRLAGPVYDGLIEEMDVPGRPFDAVTAWEVLEHAANPAALMSALVQNVTPGGLIALSTPRSDGIPARVMGERFPMICPPEHLSLFSRESLIRMARFHGLQIIHYSSFSNLTSASLASGLSKRLWGKDIRAIGAARRTLLRGAGFAATWAPWLIDRAGLGTEMQFILRAPSA